VEAPPPAAAALALLSWSTISVAFRVVHLAGEGAGRPVQDAGGERVVVVHLPGSPSTTVTVRMVLVRAYSNRLRADCILRGREREE
jgi:hypothetical protein